MVLDCPAALRGACRVQLLPLRPLEHGRVLGHGVELGRNVPIAVRLPPAEHVDNLALGDGGAIEEASERLSTAERDRRQR